MDDNLITPSDFFHRGMESLENGKYSEAVSYFEAAVQREYFDPDIHLPMAEALFEVGRYNEALEHFNQAQAAGINPSDILLWKGSCYLELRRTRRAISAFNRVLEADPNHAEAHFKRGLALSEIGSPDRALEAFTSAERILREQDEPEPEALAEVLMWKGRALTRLGRRADGMALMFEAWELAPEHPGPYNEIADSFRFSGDLGGAEEWYRKGLDRLPEDPSLHNDYGNLLRELGRYRESLDHLTTAIERDANRSVAYYNRALTLERLELYDEALKDYDTVIESNPVDLDAKLRKLDLLTQMGIFADAEALLRELTPEESRTNEAREALARMRNRQALRAEAVGDIHAALASHRIAIGLHPDFLDVESLAPGDERLDDRLKRLAALVEMVPPASPDFALAGLLRAAALFTSWRFNRLDGTEAKGADHYRKLMDAGVEGAIKAGEFTALAHKLGAEIAFHDRNDDDAALAHADAALAEIPDYVGALWVKAVILAEGKLRPDLAVECYRRMLEITPNNSSVLLNLGDLYFEHGQPHRALSYYRRVLEERPGDVSINRDIGHCYLALQRYGEAIACFSRLEAQGAMQLEVRLDLAEAHLAVGERAEAAKLIDEALEENAGLDPMVDGRATELKAALLLSRRNAKGARKELRKLDDDLLSTFGMLQMGRAAIQLEHYNKAWDCLQEITDTLVPHAPDAVEARYHMARILFTKGDHNGAVRKLEEMLQAAPMDERAYRMLGWIHMLNGEMDAVDEIDEARKFAQTLAKLQRLLHYEDFAEALSSAEALAQDYPARIEPRYYKACALAQLGDDEAALEELRAIVKQTPEVLLRVQEEFYLEPLRIKDRLEFRQ